MKKEEKKPGLFNVRAVVLIAILSGVAFLLNWIEIPILPIAPYLKYDPSNVISIVAGFIFGPVYLIAIELIKSLLFIFSGKSTSGWIGAFAMISAGLGLGLGTTFLYRIKQNKITPVIGVLIGTFILTVLMVILNYFVLLSLWGIPEDQRVAIILTAIIPFNILKGLISGTLAVILLKVFNRRLGGLKKTL